VLALIAFGVLVLGIVVDSHGGGSLWPFAVVAAVLAVVSAVLWFALVPRMATSWRYAEREQDLLVRHGRVFRRLTVVPYGRMQVIQVRSNPIAQRLGIATVTLVTASADTDARIPGLPSEVAQALRDRLAAKGEALTAGL
jgi:membrane protein YdbS with pleckstrin-like domain